MIHWAMTQRSTMILGLCALALGGLTAGCARNGLALRPAGAAAPAFAARAEKALEHRDPAAVTLAEAAVQAEPGLAARRFLLARAYLAAGRFVSAREAFGDALMLDPANGRAALDLALTQIACDDADAALRTLATHGDRIAIADRGLATALAGAPDEAVAMLMAAARQPGADTRLRQNLGLSLGLAGQWPMARAVAALDISPAEIDARMLDWIAFAQSRAAGARVAALLHVRQAPDMGQPVALALNRTPGEAVAAKEPLGTVLAAQALPAAPVETVAEADPVDVAAAPVAARPIVFGPRREVVQPLPGRIELAQAGGRKAP